jgi:hypothetical protein
MTAGPCFFLAVPVIELAMSIARRGRFDQCTLAGEHRMVPKMNSVTGDCRLSPIPHGAERGGGRSCKVSGLSLAPSA